MAIAQTTSPQAAAVGFKRIVVATDFSKSSAGSLHWAIDLAREFDSEIFLVHAIPALREPIPLEPMPQDVDPQRAQAERRMRELISTSDVTGVKYDVLIETGDPSKVVPWIAQREKADLLVLGTHGREGLSKLARGSVAEALLRLVPLPVVTVGGRVSMPEGPFRFNTVLFATDFGEGAARALPFALALVEDYGSNFILLHVIPPFMVADAGPAGFGTAIYLEQDEHDVATKKQQSVRKLMEIMPAQAKLPHAPEYLVHSESAAEGILIAASENHADLIVMGVHGVPSPHAAAHVPWSVVHQVISKAKCPVLTVRG